MCAFTIFQAEGAGILEPLRSVSTREGSFPRVTEGGGCSLQDALGGPHIVRQHHVEVATQPWKQQWQFELEIGLLLVSDLIGTVRNKRQLLT